jgi:large subunit ribosomal protein L25
MTNMSNDTIAVDLQERSVLGKGLAGLRKQGFVPAVIHDHGKASIHVMGDYTVLTKAYEQAGRHHPVQLSVGKANHLALIKDADFEPTKHQLRHVVFQAIKQNEKAEAEIPVVLTGDIPAEMKNLMVITGIDAVEVEALPKDLPDEINVDASVLAEAGDKLQVSDLIVPAGVTILTDPETMVAMVEMPKDQIAVADAAAQSLADDAAASAEPTDEAPKAEAESTESSEEE